MSLFATYQLEHKLEIIKAAVAYMAPHTKTISPDELADQLPAICEAIARVAACEEQD